MRKRRFISLPQRPSWSMLCCALLLTACNHTRTDTLNDPSPAIGEATPSQSPSTASISPFADLSDDTLIPPAQPALSITAQVGTLNFRWLPIEGQRMARLYKYDPLSDGETLTHEFEDSTAGDWQLQSHTHTTAWHRQQYRVELCNADDCVSSPRMSLSGLATNTLDSLSPAVFIKGERYADRIALNHNATLAVLTLPVEGALEIQARIGNRWTLIQRLRLNALSLSSTRTLDVASSDSGDTLAVFVQDSNVATDRGIRILERLGEAWLETAAWPVNDTVNDTVNAPVHDQADQQSFPATPYTALTMAASGEQIVVHSEQTLVSFRQTEAGWSSLPQTLTRHDAYDTPESQTSSTSERLMASAQNAEFTRLFTLVEEDQLLYLSVWTPSGNASTWQRRAHFDLPGLNPTAQLAIMSNTAGSSVIVAGWEDTDSGNRAPVMWRYSLEATALEILAEPVFSLSMTDSLRAPPTEQANPSLVFAADASLSIIALGWHSTIDSAATSTTSPDAALNTYVYDPETRQWLSALELPESLPTLAKQPFAAEIILSADGMTMMMASKAGTTDPARSRAGEILVMR